MDISPGTLEPGIHAGERTLHGRSLPVGPRAVTGAFPEHPAPNRVPDPRSPTTSSAGNSNGIAANSSKLRSFSPETAGAAAVITRKHARASPRAQPRRGRPSVADAIRGSGSPSQELSGFRLFRDSEKSSSPERRLTINVEEA